jgi:hypothetical protein
LRNNIPGNIPKTLLIRERSSNMFTMNRLPPTKRAQILGILVEGTSLRSAARIADVSINTVTKHLADVGAACAAYQDAALQGLPCKHVLCEEIWSFSGATQKSLATGSASYGDVWTWTALCVDTKLIASWMVGSRDDEAAQAFIADLVGRLRDRQPTIGARTRGLHAETFEADGPCCVQVRPRGDSIDRRRYGRGTVAVAEARSAAGSTDTSTASITNAELQNPAMRMFCPRFMRLTNECSRKVENLAHAVALHFMHYNFVRIDKSLRVTPAMQAGVSDHVWSLEEIAALVPEPERKPRGPNKKRVAA